MIRPALVEEIDLLCDRLGEMDPWKRLDIAGEALAKGIKDDPKRDIIVWDEAGRVLGVIVFRTYGFAEVAFDRGFGMPLASHHNVPWPCEWTAIPDGGYVHALAVFDEGHGKGVGSQLLRAAENHTLRGGIHKMYLMVSDFNKAAHGFYAMQRYRRIASLEDCLKAGNTEHLMQKRLRDAGATW
jgi:GNAT superfamily N-acetyltransferase